MVRDPCKDFSAAEKATLKEQHIPSVKYLKCSPPLGTNCAKARYAELELYSPWFYLIFTMSRLSISLSLSISLPLFPFSSQN